MMIERFSNEQGHIDAKAVVDFFEEDLRNYSQCPDKYVDFFHTVFSTEQYFDSKNLWKILHMLTSECLSPEQFFALGQTLSVNFGRYRESMLIDMSCDFIARACSEYKAMELFTVMKQSLVSDTHKACLSSGLRILVRHTELGSEFTNRVKRLADAI
jgi:hypothetical protein